MNVQYITTNRGITKVNPGKAQYVQLGLSKHNLPKAKREDMQLTLKKKKKVVLCSGFQTPNESYFKIINGITKFHQFIF